MKLYLFASTDESTKMEGGLNSVIAAGSDENAARTATVLAAKINGGFCPAKFAAWSSYPIADGAVTLPGSSAALFMGKAYGSEINPLPGV